jgi:hypothetical protein
MYYLDLINRNSKMEEVRNECIIICSICKTVG